MTCLLIIGLALSVGGAADSQDAAVSVQSIRDRHDRALIADLRAYLEANPTAGDRDAGYLKLFETAVDHDWYADVEPLARAYLDVEPRGAVAPMARIVTTMARAKAGDFDAAAEGFRRLLAGLDDDRQVAFAADFAQSLAGEAIAAGRTDVAGDVYGSLRDKFGADPDLRADVGRWQSRLELVGRPAPAFEAADLEGKPIRLADFKGKHVLLDFWATWCAPAIEDRPALLAAYRNHRAEGLEIVSISLDDDPEAVRRAATEGGWGWRQVHAATAGADLLDLYRIEQVPASVLIDPEGRVERLDLKGKALDALLRDRTKAP